MTAFNPAAFTNLIALVGLVIIVASLASGLVERLGLPVVAVFLALGTILGPHGLGLIDFGLDSPTLGAIATLSLVLVLFTDALGVDPAGLRAHARIAGIVLGPGTILSATITGFTGWWLLGLHPAAAAILGAALASTDPVMLRGLLRLPEVPAAARYALRIEAGLNDVVLLPVVLVAMVFLAPDGASPMAEAGRTVAKVFFLGPLAGALVGFIAIKLMESARGWMGMRKDYESLYVLGIAFTAYAAAEALHASGFMAAFAAGIAVSVGSVELCDCFQEYGEATAEMLLLLSFIAFGASLIWTGLFVFDGKTLLFAGVALLGRPLVLSLTLPRKGLDPIARRLIVWFGPRALSSLLLVLLPIFAGMPGSERLFPVTALVVLISVVGHGAMLVWATQGLKYRGTDGQRDGKAAGAVAELAHAELVGHAELITFEEFEALRRAGARVQLLDVRAEKAWSGSPIQAAGAIRVRPNAAVESAARLALPREDWLVAYCA